MVNQIKSIAELKSVHESQAEEFMDAYIFVRITDEIMLTSKKSDDEYQFRELKAAYSPTTHRFTGYACQYMNVYKDPVEALDELRSRAVFLESFLKLNKTEAKIDGSVTRMVC